jgi:uncharacterized membrane protein
MTLGSVQYLNNTGSNIGILMILGVVILIIGAVIVARHKLSDSQLSILIYSMSLSLLFTYSLRGNHLVGWDVQSEYRVFQLVKNSDVWTPHFYNNAYYSMLSITTLPTLLQHMTGIADEYVYKLLFPVIFAFTPVIIFCLLKRFTTSIKAFLAVIFFVIQNQFFQQMPALARQEIAMFFFVLLLYTVFSFQGRKPVRVILSIMFAFSMVVSHYSTTYIAIAILCCVYFFNKINLFLLNKIKKTSIRYDFKVDFIFLLILLTFTFLWYSQVTNTNIFFKSFADNTITKFSHVFTGDFKSEQAKLAIVGVSSGYTNSDVINYDKSITNNYKKNINWITYYPEAVAKEYKPVVMYAESAPTIEPYNTYSFYINEIVKKLFKIFLVLGLAYMFFKILQYKDAVEVLEYFHLCIGFSLLLIAIIVLPNVSIAYNFERMYQQSLIVLSLPIILGSTLIFEKLSKNACPCL